MEKEIFTLQKGTKKAPHYCRALGQKFESNLAVRLGVIFQELRQTDVGQRVLQQGFHCAQWSCHHVRTNLRTLNDVHRVTYRSGQDFSAEIIVVEDHTDALDQI